MKLYEYQGKTLFAKSGLKTPKGVVIHKLEELEGKLPEIRFPSMVKAQVLTGGRGKAGGVVAVNNAEELKERLGMMLGAELKENTIAAALVEEKASFVAEYYLSITRDSKSRMPMIMFSTSGGINIEEVAATTPEKIAKILVDPLGGVQQFHIEKMCKVGEITDKALKAELKKVVLALYECYENYDAMVVEINPLMVLTDGTLLAADSKMEIDDAGVPRHPELQAWQEALPSDPLVKEAHDNHLLYIDVSDKGNVGVISNGSGMIMSCTDWIAREGGKVACAIDLGGGATAAKVAKAIEIILKNENVAVLLISIFGGITRCDEIAGGIIKAVEEMSIEVPVVAKLDGTNKEQGMELLVSVKNEKIQIADGLKNAAEKVMQLQEK